MPLTMTVYRYEPGEDGNRRGYGVRIANAKGNQVLDERGWRTRIEAELAVLRGMYDPHLLAALTAGMPLGNVAVFGPPHGRSRVILETTGRYGERTPQVIR